MTDVYVYHYSDKSLLKYDLAIRICESYLEVRFFTQPESRSFMSTVTKEFVRSLLDSSISRLLENPKVKKSLKSSDPYDSIKIHSNGNLQIVKDGVYMLLGGNGEDVTDKIKELWNLN